jgi:phosphoserine phosphatase
VRAPESDANAELPLVVDLDGTLIADDTLVLGFKKALRGDPLLPLKSLAWLAKGRAHLKLQIAALAPLDVTSLPYRWPLIEYLNRQKDAGRALYLGTAAHQEVAHAVASHVGIFTDVFASTAFLNLKGRAKADCLVKAFGRKRFVYAGDSRSDLAVWREAAAAILVNVPDRLAEQARRLTRIERRFDS